MIFYAHAAVEVHAVDTNRRVVLDAQVDVLRDTETKVASLGEVALAELVLLDLEATFENLLGLGATDGNVNGDFFVTTDTESTDGVAGLAFDEVLVSVFCYPQSFARGGKRTVDGGLTAQLLKHLCGSCEPVTGLADGDVEDQLLDAELAHGVGRLVLAASVALHHILAIGLLLRRFSLCLCGGVKVSAGVLDVPLSLCPLSIQF